MLTKILAYVGLLAVFCPALAIGSSLGRLKVVVIDAQSRKAIAATHVHLEGDSRSYDGFTDVHGVVTFPQVVQGEYGLTASFPGYAFRTPQGVTITDTLQTLTLAGIRTALPEIARLEARQKPPSHGIRHESAAALLAGSVTNSLDALPAFQTVGGMLTIHGRADTTALINGAPVFAAGTPISTGLLSADVFQSADLSLEGLPGAPGGALNLATFDPTIDWMGSAVLRGGSFGSYDFGLRERGTSGRLGISFSHSLSSTGTPLDGRYFLDTTGSSYSHQSYDENTGDTATLRYPLNENSAVSFDVGRLQYTSAESCRILQGTIPCGYGPSASLGQTLTYAQLRGDVTSSRWSADVHVFNSSFADRMRFPQESFFGDPAGYSGTAYTKRFGISLRGTYLLSGGRMLTTSYTHFDDAAADDASVQPSYDMPANANATDELSVQYPAVNGRRIRASVSVGAVRSADLTRPRAGVTGTYLVNSRDSVDYAFDVGESTPPYSGSSGVSAAGSLFFDCASLRAQGFGPSAATSGGSSRDARLEYRHNGSMFSSSVGLFSSTVQNGIVTGTIPASALPLTLSSAYFADAASTGARVCGESFPATNSNLYYTLTAPAGRTVTEGLDARVDWRIGTRGEVVLDYSDALATAYALPREFTQAIDVRSGAQLPGVARRRASITAAYKVTPEISMLADATYFGKNNSFIFDPFVSVDLGLQVKSGPGDFVLAFQNVAGAASPLFAQIHPFPFVETPYKPRAIQAGYRFFIGNGSIDRTAMLSAPQLPTSGNLFFVPEPFDNASASWLEPNTQSPFCGVEQLPRAQAMLNAIRSYASEVARAQRLGATVAPERVDGMTISYIPSNAAGYVLRIALDNDAAVIGPFWRCARLHEGDYDEAAQAHLFIPGWRERYQSGVQTLYFSPEVGLYFAPDAIDETVGSRSVSATFPSKRSINDVAVIPRLCPSEFEAASVQFMNDFRSYAARYYRGDQPLPAPGMEVHVHNSKAGAWLEALPANPDLTAAIALCFNIPSATQDQLSRFGLSGGIPPSINYSPKVGLYLVSPSQ